MKVGIIAITTIIIILIYARYSANQFIYITSICIITPILQRIKLRPRIIGDTLGHIAESNCNPVHLSSSTLQCLHPQGPVPLLLKGAGAWAGLTELTKPLAVGLGEGGGIRGQGNQKAQWAKRQREAESGICWAEGRSGSEEGHQWEKQRTGDRGHRKEVESLRLEKRKGKRSKTQLVALGRGHFSQPAFPRLGSMGLRCLEIRRKQGSIVK